MSDLIDKQAAIEELKKTIAVNRNPNHDARVWEEGMNCACSIIGSLPSAQPEHRWIPCSERMPEEHKDTYWICTDSGYQCEARWTDDRFGLGHHCSWGWNFIDVPQYHKVTAWMPLPEPWRGEGS